MKSEDYQEQASQLLPPGRAWSRAKSGPLAWLLEVLAGQLSVCHGRAENLINEADPRTTLELLPEWEDFAGLPDECTAGLANTIPERRAALVEKLTGRHGLAVAKYVDLIRRLGYEAVIEEYRPFECGRSECGDTVPPWPTDLPAAWRGPDILGGPLDTRLYWRVWIPATGITWFHAGESACGERLGDFVAAPDLECILRRRAPAHDLLLFSYMAWAPGSEKFFRVGESECGESLGDFDSPRLRGLL